VKRIYIVENDPIYHTLFAIHKGGPRKKAFDWYVKKTKVDPTKEQLRNPGGNPRATFLGIPGHLCFVFWFRDDLPDTPTPDACALVAHEALHAALHVMHVVGVDLNTDSEEALTYYHGYLVSEIHKRLWPERKPNGIGPQAPAEQDRS
jgi:hypothetical protein